MSFEEQSASNTDGFINQQEIQQENVTFDIGELKKEESALKEFYAKVSVMI